MGLPAKELTFHEVRRFESSHLRQRRSRGAISPWCNGNTSVFGADVLGSNPGGEANEKCF